MQKYIEARRCVSKVVDEDGDVIGVLSALDIVPGPWTAVSGHVDS